VQKIRVDAESGASFTIAPEVKIEVTDMPGLGNKEPFKSEIEVGQYLIAATESKEKTQQNVPIEVDYTSNIPPLDMFNPNVPCTICNTPYKDHYVLNNAFENVSKKTHEDKENVEEQFPGIYNRRFAKLELYMSELPSGQRIMEPKMVSLFIQFIKFLKLQEFKTILQKLVQINYPEVTLALEESEVILDKNYAYKTLNMYIRPFSMGDKVIKLIDIMKCTEEGHQLLYGQNSCLVLSMPTKVLETPYEKPRKQCASTPENPISQTPRIPETPGNPPSLPGSPAASTPVSFVPSMASSAVSTPIAFVPSPAASVRIPFVPSPAASVSKAPKVPKPQIPNIPTKTIPILLPVPIPSAAEKRRAPTYTKPVTPIYISASSTPASAISLEGGLSMTQVAAILVASAASADAVLPFIPGVAAAGAGLIAPQVAGLLSASYGAVATTVIPGLIYAGGEGAIATFAAQLAASSGAGAASSLTASTIATVGTFLGAYFFAFQNQPPVAVGVGFNPNHNLTAIAFNGTSANSTVRFGHAAKTVYSQSDRKKMVSVIPEEFLRKMVEQIDWQMDTPLQRNFVATIRNGSYKDLFQNNLDNDIIVGLLVKAYGLLTIQQGYNTFASVTPNTYLLENKIDTIYQQLTKDYQKDIETYSQKVEHNDYLFQNGQSVSVESKGVFVYGRESGPKGNLDSPIKIVDKSLGGLAMPWFTTKHSMQEASSSLVNSLSGSVTYVTESAKLQSKLYSDIISKAIENLREVSKVVIDTPKQFFIDLGILGPEPLPPTTIPSKYNAVAIRDPGIMVAPSAPKPKPRLHDFGRGGGRTLREDGITWLEYITQIEGIDLSGKRLTFDEYIQCEKVISKYYICWNMIK
jgi:hypothetical protein